MSIMNTYVQGRRTYGGGKTVWHTITEKYPVGGSIDVTKYKAGDLVPAGSMVALDVIGGKAEIVTKDDAVKLKDVIGLTQGDIYVPENAVAITTDVVTKGMVEADLIPEVPAEVVAKLSGITFARRFKQETQEAGGEV